MCLIPCLNKHGACQASGPLEQRKEQEMFYSCPSVSAEAFFRAVSSQLASLEGSSYASSPESQLKQTHEVAQAVQASLTSQAPESGFLNTLHF